MGCFTVTVFGTLPEQALIVAEEGSALHLTLMLQNGIPLFAEFLGTHGNAHLNICHIPFGPGATIHPNAAVGHPCCARFLLFVNGSQHGIGAFAVGAVGVGKVGGHINLMRLNVGQQSADGFHVALRHGQFLYFTAFVERQLKEMNMTAGNAIVGTSQPSLALAYQTLHGQHLG